SRMCASFSTAGTILKLGIVPVELVLEGLEPTLRRCFQILEPFLREMQKPENGGPQYWVGFDWLHSQLDRPKAVGRKGPEPTRRQPRWDRRGVGPARQLFSFGSREQKASEENLR